MILNADQCYQAVLTRDARFDGRFFVAVRSTRIYCRPICRVKTPMRKNCTFFPHAAAAEAAGYRPCKRCRPELAPGNSSMDDSSQLARDIAWHISQDFLADRSLEELAEALGVTDRHMRRVFHDAFGVSPIEFWQTQRLLLAKQLLADSNIPVTQVALAAGFQSVRRFNALLKQRYRLSPTELRRDHRQQVPRQFADFAFRLAYRPPMDWDRLLQFLSQRAIPHVEAVSDGVYTRSVRVTRPGREWVGWIAVAYEPDRHMLAVRLSDALLPACAVVLERVKRLFDLHADPIAIALALGPLAAERPGLRVPGSFDGFELAVRAILGQQISVAGARTLAGRIAEQLGSLVNGEPGCPQPGLIPPNSDSGLRTARLSSRAQVTHLFPTPQQIAAVPLQTIKRFGITTRRAHTLIALADSMASGRISLEPGRRIEETLADLRRIPGIGEWTAQYIAMRALAWPDAFPHTDLGIRKGMNESNPATILKLAEKWRPWRSYAAVHLWSSLEKAS